MCGVVGVLHSDLSSKNNAPADAAFDVYRSLLTLQHRGQDAAGIVSYSFESKRFSSHKELGLVGPIFNEAIISKLSSPMAIGHTRYATTGSDSSLDLQPIITGFPQGISLAHNGNIVNYHDIKKSLSLQNNTHLITNNDIELFQSYWCQAFVNCKDNFLKGLIEGAKNICENLMGGYALVGLMSDQGMFGLRDPKGIRPLSLGKKVNEHGVSWILSSETIAMNFLGFEYVRDIEPGEFIFIHRNGELVSERIVKEKSYAPCMFEWVYFSGAESSIENKSVYSVRLNLGNELAKSIKPLLQNGEIKADIVCPVPDTSRTSAISLAEQLGLPYREGLIKNRYTQRSFILKDQRSREQAIELKLSPVLSEIKGKNILLVDDSIVRGTTSKKIIKLLKKYGAKEVSLALTCPPLKYSCYYGVDFPDANTLMAKGKNIEQMASAIEADNLVFINEEQLQKAIGLEDTCNACLNGNYPTNIEGHNDFIKFRNIFKNNLEMEC
jgi:amidophosphoribosyltransferase